MENVLLPAERKLVELGEVARVREGRVSFQEATATDFVAAVEKILLRKVRAFASALDAPKDTIFEVFTFEPKGAEELGDDLDGGPHSGDGVISDGSS